jgi:hypothetical protein
LDVSDNNAVITGDSNNLGTTSPCNGNVQLTWTALPGISLYKVFLIKNETLFPLDTVTGTSFIIRDLPWILRCGCQLQVLLFLVQQA